MKKNNSRRFPALMVISLLILSPVFLLKTNPAQASGSMPDWQEGQQSESTEYKEQKDPEKEGSPSKESGKTDENKKPQDTLHANDAAQDTSPAEETTQPAEADPVTPSGPEETSFAGNSQEQTLNGFFSQTLFIGDSRSVGLMEYAGLETPDFFASSGMSLFKMWDKEIEVLGMGKMTLQELLEQKTYDRIFLMTGINELGYAHSAILKKYEEAAESIQNLQPQAKLYLCANLHVTASRSDRDDTYNNANIDWLNGEIAGIADRRKAGFLDVNPLFDDAQGALCSDFSGDETHPYGKYYQRWGEWLYETCRNAEALESSPDESNTG